MHVLINDLMYILFEILMHVFIYVLIHISMFGNVCIEDLITEMEPSLSVYVPSVVFVIVLACVFVPLQSTV
jgi:hypothetical protein